MRQWRAWKLASDEETYGTDAGKYILVSEDGEEEHSAGVVYSSEADATAAAAAATANANRIFWFMIYARKRGALGVRSWFTAMTEAPDIDAAKLALYETFEHVYVVKWEEGTAEGLDAHRRAHNGAL